MAEHTAKQDSNRVEAYGTVGPPTAESVERCRVRAAETGDPNDQVKYERARDALAELEEGD